MRIKIRESRPIFELSSNVAEAEAAAIVRLWMLRCLVPLHGFGPAAEVDQGVWRAGVECDEGFQMKEMMS